MNTQAADLIKASLRRAIPLIIVLMVVGAGALTALKQNEGVYYTARAEVFLSSVDLGAVLTGIQAPYVEPNRAMDNAVSLARSSALYERAGERIGQDGAFLQGITSVSGRPDADVLVFTSTADEPDVAVEAVNAVASVYPEWRADVAGSAVNAAIEQIQRRLASDPANSEELEQQLERLELLRTLSSGNTMLIEPAAGAARIGPEPVEDALLGAGIGLVLALLLSAVREIFDARVRSELEVEDVLASPVLASIPRHPRRARLVMLTRHEDRFSDTYALLAANVMHFRRDDEPLVVAVTSAAREEGKTATVANLAVALARRGQDVVLVDFDVRRPSVGPLFTIPAQARGVIQAIEQGGVGKLPLYRVPLNGARPDLRARTQAYEKDVLTVSRAEAAGGSLQVLPAGGSSSRTLAAAAPAAELLRGAREVADVVLVDTPPALSVPEMADLAGHVDAVLVVVRHGRTTLRSLRSLSRQAKTWSAGITGAVLTDAPVTSDYYPYHRA